MAASDALRLLGILRQPGFLDRETCELLRSEVAAGRGIAAPIVGGVHAGEETIEERTRKTRVTAVADSAKQLVADRLAAARPSLEEHFRTPLGNCQEPQFLTYGEGDFFRGHRDAHPDSEVQFVRERKVSAVIFLNGESEDPERDGGFSGGALVFYELLGAQSERHGLSIRGEPGLLVAFRSELLHEVLPVTAGTRETVVTWFLAPDDAAS